MEINYEQIRYTTLIWVDHESHAPHFNVLLMCVCVHVHACVCVCVCVCVCDEGIRMH